MKSVRDGGREHQFPALPQNQQFIARQRDGSRSISVDVPHHFSRLQLHASQRLSFFLPAVEPV